MVPGTCPFYLHFRAQLSPGWMWLCLYLHTSLGIQLGPGGLTEHPRYLEGSTLLNLHTWAMTNTAPGTSPGCWGKREAAKKTQTNRDADSEEKEEPWTKQTRRRGEIKTKELVTGYPRPVSHFASASLHLQSTETHLQLCPFPDTP